MCGKSFKTPSHLREIKIKDNVEAKFQCDHCALKTKNKINLVNS